MTSAHVPAEEKSPNTFFYAFCSLLLEIYIVGVLT